MPGKKTPASPPSGRKRDAYPPSGRKGPAGSLPPAGPETGKRIMGLYGSLSGFFGPRNWWPGDYPFEVMLGAVLTQNTAWRNVEKAILNLKEKGFATPEGIRDADPHELRKALVPSGYYNVKAERVLALTSFILENGAGGECPEVLSWPMDKLRRELLKVRGVGPETADSIVLYAAGHPSFVVDAYTKRILKRHFGASGEEDYEEIRSWFMESLPGDRQLYNELHALIVAAGHNFCSPRTPRCEECPLGKDPRLAVR